MARDKRPLEPSDCSALLPDAKRPRAPALASIITEALKVESLQKLCALLEPALRQVVSEEVERVMEKLSPNLNGSPRTKRIQVPAGIRRNLRLQFKSNLSLPLFTGSKIEGEHATAVQVILLDTNTGQIITTGPESSAKLEVVVLEGDFNREDDEDWTAEDFESNIVREREGKGPLLTGDLQINLRNGVGTLGELVFTDNSSWIRSRKFRLGVKPLSEFSHIREAKTEAFAVKDHRGELYKKHYPPAPQDEIWRLEKVGKDGSFHKRLNQEGILTVEDFLRYAARDPQKLRNILGSGMSNKMWESLVEHARTCVLSGKLYIYYSDDSKIVGAAFNSVYELYGLIAGQQYYPVESLSEDQKVFAEGLMKKAHDDWTRVVEYEGKALPSSNKPNNAEISSQDTSLPFSTDYFTYDQSIPHAGSQTMGFNEASPFDGGVPLGGTYVDRMDGYPGLVGSDLGFFDQALPSCLPEDSMQDLLCRAPIGTPDEYSYMWPSSNQDIALEKPAASSGKAVVGWLKIKAAMRWGIFVRKKAAERRAKLVELAH